MATPYRLNVNSSPLPQGSDFVPGTDIGRGSLPKAPSRCAVGGLRKQREVVSLARSILVVAY